ncbi:neuropeptide CCHamide-2 receptor [Morone saxatilis]|uniref:neuropeptide CCHamide-2 receptor n=1 Tax=Morone saxatilis TaxID=34816 RepID=UPI0015E1BC5A|nr:neuropeptide CCHamide-2 receptor [Morone saxatilis]
MPAIVNLLFNVVSTNTTISFSVVLPMVSLVSLVVGVGGHLLLWLVLVRNPRSRSKPSSVLLLNLSLADLGALLTLPCVLLSASFQNWQLGGGTCVLLGFTTSVTVGVEIFSLAAYSVLRYRIVAPRMRPPASLTQVLCTVVAIWLVSVAMALPKVTYINFDGGCTWAVSRNEWLLFLVPAFLVYYVAPLFCIAVNCGLIISHLHGCRGTLAADRRNKKATALLIGSTLGGKNKGVFDVGGGIPDSHFVGVSGSMLEPATVLPVVTPSCTAAPSSAAFLRPQALGKKTCAALAYCSCSSPTPATPSAA